MFKNNKQLLAVAVTVALLAAVTLWGSMLTGTAAAQSAPPYTPGPGWHQGMMGQGMMGHGMMGHGTMGQGMMGQGMMGCGCGMMGHGMMGQSLGISAAVTGTLSITATGIPENLPAALEAADATRGQQLVLSAGCAGCHSLDPNQPMVGPNWHDLAETAATRVQGQNAAQYLYTSIVQPNAYVVPGFQPNVMVQGYGRTLGEQDLAAIVKYLLSLHG